MSTKNIESKAESRLQAEIVAWYTNNFCLRFHNPRGFIFSVPNELAAGNALAGVYAKAMGLKSGVSDLVVGIPQRPGETGKILFVELKTPTGRQSEKQREFQATVEALGMSYNLIRSVEEFKNLIIKWREQNN